MAGCAIGLGNDERGSLADGGSESQQASARPASKGCAAADRPGLAYCHPEICGNVRAVAQKVWRTPKSKPIEEPSLTG